MFESPVTVNEISSLLNNSGLCSSDVKAEQKKVADEEVESRRQLQLADGGLGVETEGKEKMEKQEEMVVVVVVGGLGQIRLSMYPPNDRIMTLVHLPLNHNHPIRSVGHSHLYLLQNQGCNQILRCQGDGETHSLGSEFVTFPVCVASDSARGCGNLISAPISMQNGS